MEWAIVEGGKEQPDKLLITNAAQQKEDKAK